ncbi:unnamed protein product [Phytomonas sp. EM1]|nr:unnamed protein product [Phytomonas sp. EM1]|eukprot:CCW64923.1 unnamed protein product [Phytomonas sp. isolate EM1]
MGTTISREQLNEYRELVKDRISEESIDFFYRKFIEVAPDGHMLPIQFKHYIDSTGVYKGNKLRQRQLRQQQPLVRTAGSFFGWGNHTSTYGNEEEEEDYHGSINSQSQYTEDANDMYPHLFRAFDFDGDGIITFKEFLIYHLAIIYSTEELFQVIFNAYDADNDGFLSLSDLKSVITAATFYVGDYNVRDREVQRVIDEEARRLMGFLDIRQQGFVWKEDMRLITQRYPQVLEKMKNLM